VSVNVPLLARSLTAFVVLTLVAGAIVWLALAIVPPPAISPDALCYWTAGKLLADAQSPYDAALQTQIQREYEPNRDFTGLGIDGFLPYYYPPWFGFLWVLLLPLGYEGARTAFLFLNVLALLLTGYLLRNTVRGIAPWMPIVLASIFAFSLACLLIGQTALLILFLIVLSWKLLEAGRDQAAGVALAWLTIKPQLTGVLLLGILLWSARQRRWGVIGAFTVMMTILMGISTLLVPSWSLQMLNAPRQAPPPTTIYPWIGNAWFLVLRSLGLQGWLLGALYLAAAVPAFVAVLRAAFDQTRSLADILSLGLLAAFFVAPYTRHYDFPVLLVPLLVLLGGRISQVEGAALLVALVLLPYFQYFLLARLKDSAETNVKFLYESTFFWIPLLLTVAWMHSRRVSQRSLVPG
jgi:hypothetical protein